MKLPIRESVPTWGIVLHQPYAILVALGLKTLETRRAPLRNRVEIVNCAGKTRDHEAIKRLGPIVEKLGIHPTDWLMLTSITSRALSVHAVTDCHELVPEDMPRSFFYEPGRFAWELEDRRCFADPPKVIGSQGFFDVRHQGIAPEAADYPSMLQKIYGETHQNRLSKLAEGWARVAPFEGAR